MIHTVKSFSVVNEAESESCLVVSDPATPKSPPGLCPWNSAGQNPGVGSHSLLQGLFPTQGSNPGLLHCTQILYHPSHQGSLSQVAQLVKNPPANGGDAGDEGSVPGSGRSPGGRNGNPLYNFCWDNPMGREAWWATVHGVSKS